MPSAGSNFFIPFALIVLLFRQPDTVFCILTQISFLMSKMTFTAVIAEGTVVCAPQGPNKLI